MKEWSLLQITEWLKGRTNVLLCVTGPTGSGKSTFLSNLARELNYATAYPGKAVRRNPVLLARVLDSGNPTASPELEDYIRSYVRKRVEDTPEGASVAIDGVPRTFEQVMFCVDLATDYNKTLVFAYLDVSRSERERRLKLRGEIGDLELMQKRLDSDEINLPTVMSRIVQVVAGGKFGFFFIVNTGIQQDRRAVKREEKIKTPEGELDTTCGDK